MVLGLCHTNLGRFSVLSGSKDTAPIQSYSAQRNKCHTVVDRMFKRLYLLRVVNNPNNNMEHSSLVYIMESRTQNTAFWSENSTFRDNGSVSIGSFVRVMCPKRIESYMRNDIPLLESGFSFVLLKTPPTLLSVGINRSIAANLSNGFVYNRASVEVSMAYPVSTQCSGFLCDRQRINDWNGTNTGCGCYGMLSNASNIAIQHSLTIETILDGALSMDNFSSIKFQQLYMRGPIPVGVRNFHFRIGSTLMNRMCAAIENCVEYINDHELIYFMICTCVGREHEMRPN